MSSTTANLGRCFLACDFTTLQLFGMAATYLYGWMMALERQKVVTNDLVLERRRLKQEVALIRHELCQAQDEKAKVDVEYGKLNKKYKALSSNVKQLKKKMTN